MSEVNAIPCDVDFPMLLYTVLEAEESCDEVIPGKSCTLLQGPPAYECLYFIHRLSSANL